eukprot:4588552-Prymnesium_polylepis.1
MGTTRRGGTLHHPPRVNSLRQNSGGRNFTETFQWGARTRWRRWDAGQKFTETFQRRAGATGRARTRSDAVGR